MVQRWGLSDSMGPIAYGEQEEEVFLGRSVTQHKAVAEETARQIDEEVRRILNDAYETARQILVEHDDKMHLMANALIKYETIDSGQIDEIMSGNEPGPPGDWWDDPDGHDGNSSGGAAATKDDTDTPIGGPASQH